jgi:hypothetical protein
MSEGARDGKPSLETTTAAATDCTKTRWYALTDLFVKAISAVAVVALGIAGWRLQSHDQKARASDQLMRDDVERSKQINDRRDRSERQYLPMLRSLTEVDLALVETSTEFAWPTYTDSQRGRRERLGEHLSYLAGTLYFTNSEPTLKIATALDNARSVHHPKRIEIPARAAVLMLAERIRLSPFFDEWDKPTGNVRLDDEGELAFDDDFNHEDAVSVDSRTVAAFQSWLPAEGMPVRELVHQVDVPTLASEMHEQLSLIIEQTVRKDPQVLAPEYIKIREDVLKSRDYLLSK